MIDLHHIAGIQLETIAAFVLLPIMAAWCIMAVLDWSRRGNRYTRRYRTTRRPLADTLERRP